jgi:tRNA modification GTPase
LAGRAASAGLLIRERQRIALERSITALESVQTALDRSTYLPELVAAELRSAMRALEALVGRIDVESLLDEIFSSFCIGK